MAYINLPPSLYSFFDKIDQRLLKLETANRFTAPVVPVLGSAPTITGLTAGDPTDPRAGDIWLNSTTNTPKYVDSLGAVGPLGNRTVISTVALSATTLINFTSIPSIYRDIEIEIILTAFNINAGKLTMTMNGITGNSYSYINQYISSSYTTNTTAPLSSWGSGQASQELTPFNYTGTNNQFYAIIKNYAATPANKIGLTYSNAQPGAPAVLLNYGTFHTTITAAITSLAITVGGTGGLTGTAKLIGVS